MSSGALEGFTCIDVSGHVAGPYAGSLLGDLGCDVLKVELPAGGDTHRGRNPKYEGYGPSFRALNRNKKSVTVDLRHKKGREILLKLLTTADIFLENFRPPTRNKLRLDYEELAEAKSETDPLLDFRLRPERSLSRQARLRHDRPSPQRHDEPGHRS